jgi:toxin ParE1/3/4
LATVDWEEPALRDLERQCLDIAQFNPAAASKVRAALLKAADSLELFPNRGRHGVIRGTRELVVLRTYIISYEVSDDRVNIIRVWHHAQNRAE